MRSAVGIPCLQAGEDVNNVAFKEGQRVRKGDLLAQIDSRPYQASLAQSEGQLVRDQGAVRCGEKNRERASGGQGRGTNTATRGLTARPAYPTNTTCVLGSIVSVCAP